MSLLHNEDSGWKRWKEDVSFLNIRSELRHGYSIRRKDQDVASGILASCLDYANTFPSAVRIEGKE